VSRSSGRAGVRVAAVVAVAAVLRLQRVVLRWDEVAIAYAAYTEPAAVALEQGSLAQLLSAWVGLHPPLHAALMAGIEQTWAAPVAWLGLSALLSVAAVWLVAREGGVVPGLMLATAPMQLADAAEVNNYPLATFAIACLCVGARSRPALFVAAVGLSCWGHVLGMCAAAAVTVWRLWCPRSPRERPTIALGALLVAFPVAVGAWGLTGQASTFSQPQLDLVEWGTLVTHAWGGVGVGLSVLVVGGLLVDRGATAAAWLAIGLAYAASLLLGAAAPHQRPYLGLLGPPAVLAVGTLLQWMATRRARLARVLTGVVLAACVARGLGAGVAASADIQGLWADLQKPRGIDDVWTSSQAGDTVWLVAPALQADDDKTDQSPVLWRLRPWWPMPRAGLSERALDPVDYLWGHPRWVKGRRVHTSTELSPRHFDAVAQDAFAAGGRVFVVLYDHAPATELSGRVDRVMRPYVADRRAHSREEGLGDDLVWELSGHVEEVSGHVEEVR